MRCRNIFLLNVGRFNSGQFLSPRPAQPFAGAADSTHSLRSFPAPERRRTLFALLAVLFSALVALPAEAQDPGAIDGPVVEVPRVRYFLDPCETTGRRPGDAVSQRVQLYTEGSLRAISVTIDFDETLLRAEEVVRPSLVDPNVTDEVLTVLINNSNDPPGVDSSERGWISVELRAPDPSSDLTVPVGEVVSTFVLRFTILHPSLPPTDAPVGPDPSLCTPVIFKNVPATIASDAVLLTNSATVQLPSDTQDIVLSQADLVNGGVYVTGIGEIGFFQRGDCNGDGALQPISDAVFLLGYNFLGIGSLPCEAACDVNGDGRCRGEVTDALYLLRHYFLGGPPPPSPFPSCEKGWLTLTCEQYCQ